MRFNDILERLCAANFSSEIVGAACAYWGAQTAITHGTRSGTAERMNGMTVATEIAATLEGLLSPGGQDIDGADAVRALVGL